MQDAPSSSETAADLPFHVYRSRLGNLPVYTDTRLGGSKKVTIVRKYAGDVADLGYRLQRLCDKPVTQFHGRLEVKGHHKQKVEEWLASLGF